MMFSLAIISSIFITFSPWWQRGYPITHNANFVKLSRTTEKYNKIFTSLTSILLSFDLRKSEVEEREKRQDVGVMTIFFLMSLLLVSNDIKSHKGSWWYLSRKFQRKINASRVVKIVQRLQLAGSSSTVFAANYAGWRSQPASKIR